MHYRRCIFIIFVPEIIYSIQKVTQDEIKNIFRDARVRVPVGALRRSVFHRPPVFERLSFLQCLSGQGSSSISTTSRSTNPGIVLNTTSGSRRSPSQHRLHLICAGVSRAIYNRGVNDGYARFVHNLFPQCLYGDRQQSQARPNHDQLNAIFYGTVKSSSPRRAQNAARSMYQLCGMPFVDLVHANFSTVRDGILLQPSQDGHGHRSITVMDGTLRTIRSLNLHHYDTRTRRLAITSRPRASLTTKSTA